ncbi:MAG: hypothetical protein QXQ94_03415 [Candidatus Bathyarchaeia archaeon]
MTLLKKSKTAVPAIAAIALVALAIVGFTYAHWSETLWLNGTVNTGNMCAEFKPPITRTDTGLDWSCGENFTNPDPHQIDKDIGSSNAYFMDVNQDGCNDTIVIELNHVYPCYYEHMSFWIHNCGTIPWRIWRVIFNPGNVTLYDRGYLNLDLNNDTKADIEIYWGNNFGDQVDPCSKVDLSFELHILQPIPQNSTLTFTVTIEMVNWNEYPPP